jgi:2-dehydro-3-deoxygluconokinase
MNPDPDPFTPADAPLRLPLRPAASNRHDLVALGECMVRLSPPGPGRLEFARSLEVDVGGGEYNAAYAAARLGWRTAFASKLPDNPLAAIVLNHARSAGMDVRHVALEPHDGLGRANRVGLYFAEIGVGVRGGQALFDRGHSSASQMGPADVDWEGLFAREGVGALHSGGIFAVLSESTRATLQAAVTAARAAGTLVSYDLNFRASLATPERAAAINREFVAQSDILVGSPEGFRALLGPGTPNPATPNPAADLADLVGAVAQAFPRLGIIAGTVRTIRQGHRHDLAGFLWSGGFLVHDEGHRDLEIVDRVGTGDVFSAGILHGVLAGVSARRTLALALAHAALVHTTRGDTSQFSAAEVEALADGVGAAMRR